MNNLPKGWAWTSLGEVASLSRRTVDPRAASADTPYIGLEHIEAGGRLLSSSSVGEANLKSMKVQFDPEHILVGKLRPYLGKITDVGFSGIASTDIIPVSAGENLNSRYLLHYIRQSRVIDHLNSTATGANLPRMSPKSLLNLPLPLPPLEEQRRIASILDASSRLVRIAAGGRHRMAQLPLSALESRITPEVPRLTLGQVLHRITTGKNLVAKTDEEPHSTNMVLSVGAVTFGRFDASRRKPLPASYNPPKDHFVREGDLLFGRANTFDLVGATAIASNVPEGTLLPDKIWRLEADESLVLPEYLRYAMSLPAFKRSIKSIASGTSGSMQNISQKKLRTLEVPVLPLGAQQDFVRQVVSARKHRQSYHHRHIHLTRLSLSLQARAFRGEL